MKPITDTAIIDHLRSGDSRLYQRALHFLYKEHYPVVEDLILSNQGDEDDAADIFQDAMVSFYQQVRTGQLELSASIRVYLVSISRNLWLRRLRARGRTVTLAEEHEDIPSGEDLAEEMAVDERREILAGLVDRLGERCRNLLKLYYYDRLRFRDIASLIGVGSEQTAKNRKARCMQQLKELALEDRSLREFFHNNEPAK
jgi:RNA polymerase sigma factor (sigma-70 family)